MTNLFVRMIRSEGKPSAPARMEKPPASPQEIVERAQKNDRSVEITADNIHALSKALDEYNVEPEDIHATGPTRETSKLVALFREKWVASSVNVHIPGRAEGAAMILAIGKRSQTITEHFRDSDIMHAQQAFLNAFDKAFPRRKTLWEIISRRSDSTQTGALNR